MKPLKALVALVVVSVLFWLGAMRLGHNLEHKLSETDTNLSTGLAMVLGPELNSDSLAAFLLRNSYVADPADAALISSHIATIVHNGGGTLENLGTINQPVNRIPADTIAAAGGSRLNARLKMSQDVLGITDDVRSMYKGEALPSLVGSGDHSIRVTVKTAPPGQKKATQPVEGVIVRLSEHYFDSIPQGPNSAPVAVDCDSVVAYAMTDASGSAVFNAQQGHYYSVLPLCPGYEYGASKGTTNGALEHDLDLGFRQREQSITPFDASTYRRIKQDRALIVRSPSDFRATLRNCTYGFLAAWWIGFFVLLIIDSRMRRHADLMLMVIAMALTSVMWLAMFSISEPLTDKPNGLTMTKGAVVGVAAMILVSCVNFVKFRNGQSRLQFGRIKFDFVSQGLGAVFKPLRPLVARPLDWCTRHNINYPEGFGYVLIALGLIALLSIFGTGPEGSDAKVNLWGFQPSEVSKYLIVIFIATFFAANTEKMQFFSEKLQGWSLRRHITTVATILLAILLLAGIYLKVLSDMGPALVIIVTFIIMYSFARRDTAQLVLGFLTFAVALFVAARLFPGSTRALLLTALAWFVLWIAIPMLARRRIYESAIFLNVLMLMFIVGGQVLSDMGLSEGDRLLNRTAMAWGGVWNNEAAGGDQVAHGLWSLATGGLTGQGLGNGHPGNVPAGTTDMVFTGLGEIGGWIALVVVLVCFYLLLYRSLLVGRKAFRRFAFFLAAAIALVLSVQFIIIVCGSIGLIPLTGVAVPFLSFGQSSLVINLACIGILLSLSRDDQIATAAASPALKALRDRYDSLIVWSSLSFIVAIAAIAVTLFIYQVNKRDEILLRPALVANNAGARIIEYNPRIAIAMNAIGAGDIYDRNGLPLAMSEPDIIRSAMRRLTDAGLSSKEVAGVLASNRKRYYPFGAHTLFMLGDINTRDVWTYSANDPVGYVAENRHLSFLRGFDNVARDAAGKPMMVQLGASDYHPSRFLPGTAEESQFVLRDYRPLLEVLKDGVSPQSVQTWVDEHPRRDLHMTLDAALQVHMFKALDEAIKADARLSAIEPLRASVVVLDAADGDLLCSANWPLPVADTIAALSSRSVFKDAPYESHKGQRSFTTRDLGISKRTPPGSTAKVMSAMAGFLVMGDDAARYTYSFTPQTRLEAVEGGSEPGVNGGTIDMSMAIARSSNNYFINMVHDNNLYPGLKTIYEATGMSVTGDEGTVAPYMLEPGEYDESERFDNVFSQVQQEGMTAWQGFLRQRKADNQKRRINQVPLGMPWGQGNLLATPLGMARVASVVANGGTLAPTRFVLDKELASGQQAVNLLTPHQAELLGQYMYRQAHINGPSRFGDVDRVGGKTGTPERTLNTYSGGIDRRGRATHNINDAWYICYIYSEKLKHDVAVAIRLERAGIVPDAFRGSRPYTSSRAMDMMRQAVIPALNQAGYELR